MADRWSDDEWWRLLPKCARVPRRMSKAFYLAVAANVFIGVAAVGPTPWGPYSPAVAVTAITGAAVIWYTFFTYRAANAKEETDLLLVDATFNRESQIVEINVRNPTRRTVQARFFLEIWVDGEQQDVLDYYCGEDPLIFYPGEEKSLSSTTNVETEWDDYGDVVIRSRELLVRAYTCWRDDLGEIGTAGPWHYRHIFGETGFNRISSREIIEASFSDPLPTCR